MKEVIKNWLENEKKSAYVDYTDLADVTMDGSFDLEELADLFENELKLIIQEIENKDPEFIELHKNDVIDIINKRLSSPAIKGEISSPLTNRTTMKIIIIKKQEIIDDKAGEVKYLVTLNREYKATFRTPINLIETELYLDEIEALRDEFNKILFAPSVT